MNWPIACLELKPKISTSMPKITGQTHCCLLKFKNSAILLILYTGRYFTWKKDLMFFLIFNQLISTKLHLVLFYSQQVVWWFCLQIIYLFINGIWVRLAAFQRSRVVWLAVHQHPYYYSLSVARCTVLGLSVR